MNVKYLKRIIIIGVAAVITLAIAVILLVTSTLGTNYVFTKVLPAFINNLSIESASGSILGKVTLKRAVYRFDNGYLNAETVVLDKIIGDLTFMASGKAGYKDYPAQKYFISGRKSGAIWIIEKILIDIYPGSINLSGILSTKPVISWKAGATYDGIDLDYFIKGVKTSLSGDIHCEGKYDEKLSIRANIERLSGSLMGSYIEGAGKFAMENQNYEGFADINTAENSLMIKGSLTDKIDVKWDITANDLKSIYPYAGGVVLSSGSITGMRGRPVVNCRVLGKNIVFQDSSLDLIVAEIKNSQKQGIDADISAERLNIGNQFIEKLNILIKGTSDNHRVSADLSEAKYRVSLSGIGAAAPDKWEYIVEHISIDSVYTGKLAIKNNASITVSSHTVSINGLALRQQNTPGMIMFSGNMEMPVNVRKAAASISMDDILIKLPEAGVEFTVIEFAGDLADELAVFSGEISSLKGNLSFEGESRLNPELGWPSSVKLKGSNMNLIKTDEVTLTASPDLLVVKTIDSLEITGSFDIQNAQYIVNEKFRKAVITSGDEIIVGFEDKTTDTSQLYSMITASVTVRIVDVVDFSGYGIDAQLKGRGIIVKQKNGDITFFGEFKVVKGEYEAYGKKLTIEEGSLLFQGPLNNPILNIRASRQANEYKVGVVITGQLKSPQLSVFSEPALSSADALSMLLLNHRITTATKQEGDFLMDAAYALGLKGGIQITQQISQFFGITAVELGSEQAYGGTAVTVSTQLRKNFSVQYVVTPSGLRNAVRLSYAINRYFKIRSETGESSGIDLLYTVER